MKIKKTNQYKFGETKIVLAETESNKLRLIHFSTDEYDETKIIDPEYLDASTLVEIHVTGFNQPNHKGGKLSNTYIGRQLKLKYIEKTDTGLIVCQKYCEEEISLEIETFISYFSETNIFTWRSKVTNYGKEIDIEYITSINLIGINQTNIFHQFTEDELYQAHNSWQGELQWQTSTLKELGLDYQLDGEKLQDGTKIIKNTNASSWSCSQFSPLAVLNSPKQNRTSFWQIEHNGEWHWELSDCNFGKNLALRVSGPTMTTNNWWKRLTMGQSFETIPVSYGIINGGFEEAINQLNKYRRLIRRTNLDNQMCPVIFNDYMNSLMGDPTTEKEIPMIDKAAEIGCEYYVIDCGWYSDGYWWDNVGEWKPSTKRFPEGIDYLTSYISKKGMIPGLWLEIEVMGINSEFANSQPDDWFICRNGKRIKDHSRYHLDFRNEEVQKYATKVVDRLITDYGIGYIKMDYNTPMTTGSDLYSDSTSDGMLTHNRKYLEWIDSIFNKYPNLIIENCGSGGMRHDYAMLSRHSIQSVTDQTDYLRNGAIAAVSATGVTPEQSAIWSYPMRDGDNEEVIFNMVNSLLFRVHQSGHLAELSNERLNLVRDGIDIYKKIRIDIPNSRLLWPNGLAHVDDEWFSFGLETDEHIYLAIWRTESLNNQFSVDLKGKITHFEQIYPINDFGRSEAILNGSQLLVNFKQNKMARLYQLKKGR